MSDSGHGPTRDPGMARNQARAQRTAQGNKDHWARRLRGWLASVNKLVLAAIGAGLAGVITTAVIAIPHMVTTVFHSDAPLTIVGGASPGLQPSAATGGPLQTIAPGTDPCDLAGEYVIRGNVGVHGTVTTTDVADLLTRAGDTDETTGSYLLQASSGQTAVLTGIHTVLLRRVKASTAPATVIDVNPGCVGAASIVYDASIDLDAANLTPKLTHTDPLTGTTTPVTDLATVVTQDQAVQLNFDATTTQYDVTWRLRFDYAVNGKALSTTLPSAGPPFQTNAIAPGDSWLTLTLNSNGSTWSASAATAEQKRAADVADAQSTLASDYESLSTDESTLQTDLTVLSTTEDQSSVGQDLSRASQDERHVLSEAGHVGNGTVCTDAAAVAADANQTEDDANFLLSNDIVSSDLENLRSDATAIGNDLQALLQVEPGFNGNGLDTPSPAQARQAASAALADEAKAASTVNVIIDSVNSDVAAAYAYAAKAAAAGQHCTSPGPAPAPIPPVR